MGFNRFRINVISRALAFALGVTLFLYLAIKTQLFAALFITGLCCFYLVYSLIHYVEKTNRELARFFQSIKYEDFSQTFKDKHEGKSFRELRAAFTDVINAFRKTRAEKEENYHYLQTVVQHIGIGLLAIRSDGEVQLINTAAKKLFKVPRLKNVRALESLSSKLVDALITLRPRETGLIKVQDNNELLHLSLYASEFKLRGENYKLVSVQNIRSELEEKEIDAWQKLIRVLTHEIMNSITPISSLASTVNGIIKQSEFRLGEDETQDPEVLSDVQQALDTIQKRSQGLMHFVDAYRNLTLIPKPNFKVFPLSDLFTRVEKLMQANMKERGTAFHYSIRPGDLVLTADPELIEQVLINLLLNALQAVESQADGVIELKAFLDDMGRIIIQVRDNGPGIPSDDMEKIFIPFYSTKSGGSGIGLSLSRQVMRLHKGSISAQSGSSGKTIFSLKF